MSSPAIFYMFLSFFAPLVINDNFLTTLVFDEVIGSAHTGASASEIMIEKSSNGKMLFIKSKGKKLKTNLSVPTKSGKLYSFLIQTGEKPHSIVKVKDGKKGEIFMDVHSSNGVRIQESKKMSRAINESKKTILINFEEVPPRGVLNLPKGPPVYIFNKRVYR